MPSNDSPAFDVLNAEENDLWEWAVERAGVENAATYIRDETLKAARARQTERGEVGETRPAYGKLRKEYDALKQSRDTDVARARVEGAREALGKLSRAYADFKYISHLTIENFVASNYPAPKPAECRLSDGSVVTRARRYGAWRWIRAYPDGCPTPLPRCVETSDWFRVVNATDTGADFDALKAFAATRTEGQ